jgi:hypothetical protein
MFCQSIMLLLFTFLIGGYAHDQGFDRKGNTDKQSN